MKRYCLTLDLKEDLALIAEYEKYHQEVWPEIIKSIKNSGISVWRDAVLISVCL
jgi:L-rhamnose mutarotase